MLVCDEHSRKAVVKGDSRVFVFSSSSSVALSLCAAGVVHRLFFLHVMVVSLLLVLFSAGGVFACSGLENVPVNQSYRAISYANSTDDTEEGRRRSAQFIEDCIRDGSDPPFGWIPEGGRGHGVFKGLTGLHSRIDLSDSNCQAPAMQDTTTGVCNYEWPNCHGTPGGLLGGGAPSCERTGEGIDPPVGVDNVIEVNTEITPEALQCSVRVGTGLRDSTLCAGSSGTVCGLNIGVGECIGGDGSYVSNTIEDSVYMGLSTLQGVMSIFGDGSISIQGRPHNVEVTATDRETYEEVVGAIERGEPVDLPAGATVKSADGTTVIITDSYTIEIDGGDTDTVVEINAPGAEFELEMGTDAQLSEEAQQFADNGYGYNAESAAADAAAEEAAAAEAEAAAPVAAPPVTPPPAGP